MKKEFKFLVFGLLIVIFLGILWAVLANKTVAFDNAIYELVTYFKNDYITTFYKFITFFGSTIFIVFLCLLFLIVYWKKPIGIIIPSCLIGSTILNNAVKVIVKRIRPIHLMLVEETSYSFPSGHTMAAVSMYGILIYFICRSNLSKKNKILFSILLSLLIVLIGLSRIYLGVHYASDVIAGILLSISWLILFITIVNKIKNKKNI